MRFEVAADIDHVRSCDCSVCRRRAGLMFRVAPEAMRFRTPLEELSVYEWNTRIARDYFCPACGVLPFRRSRSAPDTWDVNVRCLEGLDLESLPVRQMRGSELGLAG